MDLARPARASGSSPLTRGKHYVASGGRVTQRLIPTHAGKTSTSSTRHPSPKAHPHSRGENQGLTRDVAGTEGSSPLTRGKHAPGPVPCHTHGLIPTHAGKTPCNPGTPGGARAHPHSRGENTLQSRYAWRRAGSSPLTRGKPAGGAVIPGGARAHPHSRGENRLEELSYLPGPGSSPLTRGKHDAGQGRQRDHGLIPTHAGKTAPNFRPA